LSCAKLITHYVHGRLPLEGPALIHDGSSSDSSITMEFFEIYTTLRPVKMTAINETYLPRARRAVRAINEVGAWGGRLCSASRCCVADSTDLGVTSD
jgi:hypothetical protein